MNKSTIKTKTKLELAIQMKIAKDLIPTDEELSTLAGVSRVTLHKRFKEVSK